MVSKKCFFGKKKRLCPSAEGDDKKKDQKLTNKKKKLIKGQREEIDVRRLPRRGAQVENGEKKVRRGNL